MCRFRGRFRPGKWLSEGVSLGGEWGFYGCEWGLLRNLTMVVFKWVGRPFERGGAADFLWREAEKGWKKSSFWGLPFWA